MLYQARRLSTFGFITSIYIIFSLSACGKGDSDTPLSGGKLQQGQSVSFGGTIIGNNASITLSLNDDEQTFAGPSFIFDEQVTVGDAYLIDFVSTSANQICKINIPSGVASSDINNLIVTCSDPVVELRFTDVGINTELVAGDFNGDGFPDLAYNLRTYQNHTTGSNNELVQFSFGDGAGAFPDTDTSMIDSAYLFSSELTGDNLDDLVVIDGSSAPSTVVTIGGRTDNQPGKIYNGTLIRGSEFNAIRVDIDRDGDSDFITPVINGFLSFEKFAVYKNDGNGNFSQSNSFPLTGHESALSGINFAIADVDSDGYEDIIQFGYTGSEVHLEVITGNGDGTFNFSGTSSKITDDIFFGDYYFNAAESVATSDFNGDGNIDFAVTSTSDFILILLGDGIGNFSEGQRVKTSSSPSHVRIADLNKDGFTDIVSSNQDAKTLHISYGKGDGTFGDENDSPSSWESIQLTNTSDVRDVTIADFDNDGYPDVALIDIGIENNETYTDGAILIHLGVGKR